MRVGDRGPVCVRPRGDNPRASHVTPSEQHLYNLVPQFGKSLGFVWLGFRGG